MTALAFAALLSAGPLAAANVDAPVNANPTVRSEFLRGNSAGGDCRRASPAGSLDWLPVANCVSNVVSVETRANRITDPFKLGIYYGAGVTMETLKKVADSLGRSREFRDSTYQSVSGFYLAEVKRLKDRLEISEDEIRSMIRSQ